MFVTDLEEGMGDQSKFFEEICVFVIPYVIDNKGNDFERKDGRHICGMLIVELLTLSVKTTW